MYFDEARKRIEKYANGSLKPLCCCKDTIIKLNEEKEKKQSL